LPTSLTRLAKFLERALFEVPGWPDAPRFVRFRRAFPILLPAALALLLLAGSELIHKPHMNSVRKSHARLLTMEGELEGLRLAWSDQRAEEVQERADAISKRLLPSTRDAENFMEGFGSECAELGWEIRFQVYDVPAADFASSAAVVFAPALARLTAVEGNKAPLETLIKLVDRLGNAGPRVDLTRLSVTVNELDSPFVEMNLRIACAAKDEKAPE
jgi:hypothetical protein